MSELTQQIVAASSGALITSLIMTPLDVVKTRLQAQTAGFAKQEFITYSNCLVDPLTTCLSEPLWRRQSVQLTGTLDALIKIPRLEGIGSLWSGISPMLVMAVPNAAIYFTLYDQLKVYLNFDPNKHSMVIPLLCGSFARGVSTTVITPIELVKTKLQSERIAYNDVKSEIFALIQRGGLFSLWRGWSPMIWRDVPFCGLYFAGYEALKKYRLQYTNKDSLFVYETFVCGGLSCGVSATITLPLDVVKTHRQVELTSNQKPKRGITVQILKQLYQTKGIASWWTGWGPRIMRVVPAYAVMISSYEWCKYQFSNST